MNKILIFGDSICYGKWDAEGGWATRLRKYIDRNFNIDKNGNIQIFNLGIPGELVINTALRFEKELLSRIIPSEKNLIIIASGINDSCPNNRTNNKLTSSADFKQAFTLIINQAKEHNCDVVLIGLSPVNPARSKSLKFNNELAKEYDQFITQIANAKNVPKLELFDDLFNVGFSELLVDAAHPNSEGHKIIFEKVLSFLLEKKYL